MRRETGFVRVCACQRRREQRVAEAFATRRTRRREKDERPHSGTEKNPRDTERAGLATQRAGAHPTPRVAPARGKGRRARARVRSHSRRPLRRVRGATHRRGDAASMTTRARAREGGNQGTAAWSVWDTVGSGLGSGRCSPRDETRGGGDATADAPSRSLRTATPGSRDLARGDARDRVRSRSPRALSNPAIGVFSVLI